MQPSQLGRIILCNGSSSTDEMRARPEEAHEELDEFLAAVSLRTAETERPGDHSPKSAGTG